MYAPKIVTIILVTIVLSPLTAISNTETGSAVLPGQLYSKGYALFEEGKYVEAVQAFRELVAISPRYQYYYDIGECEYMRNRYDLAMEALAFFEKEAGEKISPDSRAFIDNVFAEGKAHVGSLTLKETRVLELWIDEEHRGDTPLIAPIFVMAGSHTVSVKKDDQVLFSQEITVIPEETTMIDTIENTAAVAPLPPNQHAARSAVDTAAAIQDSPASPKNPAKSAHPTQEKGRSALTATGIALITVGGTTLITAGVTGIMAIHKSNQLDKSCPTRTNCDESDKELQQSGQRLKNSTIIFGTTGALFAATGVVMAILGKKQNAGETAILTAAPLIGQSTMGLSLQGEF